MKKALILTLMFLMVCPSILNARIRCGNDTISIGDSTYRVTKKLKNCGEILDKEVIETTAEGTMSYDPYTDSTNVNYKEDRIKRERWWIKIEERGGSYCYPLIFESGKLMKVERWEKCN
jgi:hypothetical protein